MQETNYLYYYWFFKLCVIHKRDDSDDEFKRLNTATTATS